MLAHPRRTLGPAVLALALALGLAAPDARAKSLDTSLSATKTAQKLALVRQKVQAAVALHKTPVVVFDVDDTLRRVFGGHQVPGAAAYVNTLLQDGATVIYQCGRKESQRATTTTQLTSLGIPIGPNAQLWLKPQNVSLSAVEWKKSQKPQLKALGKLVSFFDNERCNARMFRKEFPSSCVFRLNTRSYYPDPGGTGTIWVIDNYCPTN